MYFIDKPAKNNYPTNKNNPRRQDRTTLGKTQK